MSLQFIYWFALFMILVFGGWSGFRPNGDRYSFGGWFLLFLLFVIIGLRLFGFPIKG